MIYVADLIRALERFPPKALVHIGTLKELPGIAIVQEDNTPFEVKMRLIAYIKADEGPIEPIHVTTL